MAISIYFFHGAFLTTLCLLQWWQQQTYPLILIGALALMSLLSGVLRYWRVFACGIGILCALSVVARTAHETHPNAVEYYANGENIRIEGVIADEPDVRPMQAKYTIDVERLTDGSGTVLSGIQGRVLVSDHRMWPQYEFGERIEVFGVLEKPGAIEDFHYDRYLSRYGIYAVMYRASLQSIETGQKLSLTQHAMQSLYSLKERFEHQINRIYPEPHASFMAGLLTGSRKGIPEDLMEAFNITGLTHIIAISGFNITIIIALISGMLIWLPPRVRFFPAVGAIILFTVFVGASAAVVRAAIMGILGLIALQFDRLQEARLTVLWAAFVMVAWNPKILWYDAGFQLSFLAVIGLMEFGPMIKRFFTWVPEVLAMRESLQMTMAAQIAAVPLIILLFGRLSLIAPIANLLVAPLIPLAMFFGAVGTLLSIVVFPLGQLIAYLGWGCLEWIMQVAIFCSKLPLASISISTQTWIIVLYYGGLVTLKILHKSPIITSQ